MAKSEAVDDIVEPPLYHLKTEDFGNQEVWAELDIEPDGLDSHVWDLDSWDAITETSEEIRAAFEACDAVEGVSITVTDTDGTTLYEGHPDSLPIAPPGSAFRPEPDVTD